ncbi:Ammonium transporter [hydrothermal vent metagenome]|uniref:Ammonium transporter n=1 Tax=hydrothermal vent metagenome TaxID=652676 RepID=A0A3B1CMY1_9ZZZZ
MTEIVELRNSSDVLFLMLGAAMVFAMHGGFAFLEVGTVRKKNQVNALVKILSDFGFSTLLYFFIGYWVAYGLTFFAPASEIAGTLNGYGLVKFFFMLTFAAAVPAIISGGIAERARFWPQVLSAAIFVAIVYPLFEGMVWGRFTFLGQEESWLARFGGAPFHDYAGSVVVHTMGGWLALVGVIKLGARRGRWVNGQSRPIPVSNIPWLAMGSWMLCIGWFGFNVMSAGNITGITGLVAINSLMAMVGGLVAALVVSRLDPGFVHNGALAGLVAVCAGSDQFHPIGALVVGAVAGVIFVKGFTWEQEKLKIDDVLGVWPLHGLCGAWGGVACGIFGLSAMGGIGDVTFISQLVGTSIGVVFAVTAGFTVYTIVDKTIGLRMTEEQEAMGSDLAIHHIGAYPEESIGPEGR